MAILYLRRTSEYLNRWRRFSIYIDGKQIGLIGNGETREFNIPPGQHSVYSKIDWCSSQALSFSIKENEVLAFKVGGFKYGYWLMPTGLAILVLSLAANILFDFGYLFYLVIPIFLLLVYYLTIGRKRYLTLEEIKSEGQNQIAFV